MTTQKNKGGRKPGILKMKHTSFYIPIDDYADTHAQIVAVIEAKKVQLIQKKKASVETEAAN